MKCAASCFAVLFLFFSSHQATAQIDDLLRIANAGEMGRVGFMVNELERFDEEINPRLIRLVFTEFRIRDIGRQQLLGFDHNTEPAAIEWWLDGMFMLGSPPQNLANSPMNIGGYRRAVEDARRLMDELNEEFTNKKFHEFMGKETLIREIYNSYKSYMERVIRSEGVLLAAYQNFENARCYIEFDFYDLQQIIDPEFHIDTLEDFRQFGKWPDPLEGIIEELSGN